MAEPTEAELERELADILDDDDFVDFMMSEEGEAAIRAHMHGVEREPSPERWTTLEYDGVCEIAYLLKRTYDIEHGRCVLADGQEPLLEATHRYWDDTEDAKPAPPMFMFDGWARKERTDVILQGACYNPNPRTGQTTARMRFGAHERALAVFGNRYGDFDRFGNTRFSEPEPFERVPLRFDLAYGGLDDVALGRHLGNPTDDDFVELPDETDFHYARNPCGEGFLITLDYPSFFARKMPNLEDPKAPLRPERLAVGDKDRWPEAPLPACWDWVAEMWFPRCGHLGVTPVHATPERPIAEVRRGWMPEDILSRAPMTRHLEEAPPAAFSQGAAPNMIFDDITAHETFELEHVHPKARRWRFELPGEVPHVEVTLEGAVVALRPQLGSVVIRPDLDEVVMMWTTRAIVPRAYHDIELEQAGARVQWKADR